MGGTFDPVHHGHLVAASEVGHIFQLDEVIFVPTGQPWQKDGRDVSPAEDRYLMTVIATASNPRFSVSRVDIDRPGPTYTIDTLRDLRAAAAPEDEFFFITGADALAAMLSWHDVEEMFALAHFVGCTRPGHHLSEAGLRPARSAWWRSPPSPSPPASAASASPRATPSGTCSPTGSFSTSRNAVSTSTGAVRGSTGRG